MLETFFGVSTYISQYSLGFARSKNLVNSCYRQENQSAGNQISIEKVGSSETIRALSERDKDWLAGVIDGDGNFDIQSLNGRRVLKSIRIITSNRDLGVLHRVKYLLKAGTIKSKTRNSSMYIVSKEIYMIEIVKILNGRIRLKTPNFIEACKFFNMEFKEASVIIPEYSYYFNGLIDSNGSITLDKTRNVILINLELKSKERSKDLDFSRVMPNVGVYKQELKKRNQTRDKVFYSVRFIFGSSKDMMDIYEYFKKQRLYSQFKYFKVMQIREFVDLRGYKKFDKESIEHRKYSHFLNKFSTYMNEKSSDR
ncbi:MAG: hypothetical protein CML43_11630 [Rhodobacteraceae bacterium]|nr:hypothetical protein [Paracoccaceae bacterium]